MITILDDTSVAVDTFADLQSVLQGSNDYTTVYLAADITMTAGIAILASKAEVVIDGRDPLDGVGTIHTLTEYSSSSTGYTLGINKSSSISMAVRNMKIVGRNYYGILYVPEGSAYAGVTVTYSNITYAGPQITYNPSGRTRYLDCDITIQAGYSPINEVGEVYQVEIGGKTTINQTSTAYPVFQFRGNSNSPSLTILPGADLTITAAHDFMYNSNPVALTVGEGAKLALHVQSGVCRNSSYRFSSILVDTGADFRVIRSATNGYATLYCNGGFTVNQDASVYLQANYASAQPLIYFYATGASLSLQSPKSFVLYNSSTNAMYFLNATQITLFTDQINLWDTATALASAGGLDDPPPLSWRKSDNSPVVLTATARNTGTTVTSHNFTAEELVLLPSLSYLHFGIGRVYSMGDLPLALDSVTDDGAPVSGTTLAAANVRVSYTTAGTAYSLDGRSDDTGRYAVDIAAPLPGGTQVTVKANIPFLISTATALAEDAGVLAFVSVEEAIAFNIRAISINPMLFGREEPDWALVITDTRVRGGTWYLYAAPQGPMTGDNPNHILTGSLVFRDGEGTLTPLGGTPVLVRRGERIAGEGEVITTVSWEADQGVLMRPGLEPFYNGERYTAAITWTLTDTPLEI